ncbi:unnamed protein product [Malus baccata var. baccata]
MFSRHHKLEEEEYLKQQDTFLNAIADAEDVPENSNFVIHDNSGNDFFGDIDQQGLLKPNPKKEIVAVDKLNPEEVVDLEEIEELQGIKVINKHKKDDRPEKFNPKVRDFNGKDGILRLNYEFDLEFDNYGKTRARIMEPKFRMSLAELLDEISKEIYIEENLGCKALVIVEDTNADLPALAYLSKNMVVIRITGTNGKTTTAYLIKRDV